MAQAQQFTLSQIPNSVATDSYKQTHPSMYEPSEYQSAYIEARRSYEGDEDQRIVHYGTRWFLEYWLLRQWCDEDIEAGARFYSTYNAGGTEHPFPEDLFRSALEEHNGYFPVRARALRDGTVIYNRTPQLVIEAEGKYARLVTWLESVMEECIWYASTVATLSRLVMTDIREAFVTSVDDADWWKLDYRFHDFGLRGTASYEQAIIGGSAHLLNSRGSDTCPAAYYAQMICNGGRPVACSIPATEHSVMTSFRTEFDAVSKVIDLYGNGVFATVADSYDYQKFLDELVPKVAPRVIELGGYHVVRPDSGDPVQCVVDGLRALERAYGSTTNGKGYKVIPNAGVIQGDGIDRHTVKAILKATLAAGFSAENVAFGMGAGLLHKLNRDTCYYAVKLSFTRKNGQDIDVMKAPKEDSGKISLPGELSVHAVWHDRMFDGVRKPQVYPRESAPKGSGPDLLEVIYDHGPVKYDVEDFDTVRERVDKQWNALSPEGSAWSTEMRMKIDARLAEIRG